MLYVLLITAQLVLFFLAPSVSALKSSDLYVPLIAVTGILSLCSLMFVVQVDAKNIINRFLMATTIQMLCVLFLLLIVVRTSPENAYAKAMFTLSAFMTGVLIQSGYLILLVNKK